MERARKRKKVQPSLKGWSPGDRVRGSEKGTALGIPRRRHLGGTEKTPAGKPALPNDKIYTLAATTDGITSSGIYD